MNILVYLFHQINSFLYNKIFHVENLKFFTFLLRQSFYAWKLQYKDRISVVFFAMNVSMWRYQELYEALNRHKRFNPTIVLSPAQNMAKDQQISDLDGLRHFFSLKNIPFIDFDIEKKRSSVDIHSVIKPDIIFYPQPYKKIFVKEHHYCRFINKLICYYPYAFTITRDRLFYDSYFLNHAWKLFYPTKLNFEDARTIAKNKGRNVVITGYPNSDIFLRKPQSNPWKIQNSKKKKVIWAPHFTIEEGITVLYLSNFLWMAEPMKSIVKEFSDIIQFAFKPHPRLKTELYKNRNWGKERTDDYYCWWATFANTQLETEGFIDLFLNSDAMIHDSGSFTVEYLYTQNPVLFISQDIDKLKMEKNLLGKEALDCHFIGKTVDDIHNFLVNVVLRGNDSMVEKREKFLHEQLLPPYGKTVLQNTMEDLQKSLRIK